MAAKAKEKCTECGAGLSAGPASCPLCGAEQKHAVEPGALVTEHGDYQEKVRKLRDELRRLRDGAA